jgi:hypothetical protein
MNIILNEQKVIRASELYSDETYSLQDISFYIPSDFSDLTFYCSVDENTSFLLSKEEETSEYNIYKIALSGSVSLEEGTYDISLTTEDFITNSLSVQLEAIDYVAEIETYDDEEDGEDTEKIISLNAQKTISTSGISSEKTYSLQDIHFYIHSNFSNLTFYCQLDGKTIFPLVEEAGGYYQVSFSTNVSLEAGNHSICLVTSEFTTNSINMQLEAIEYNTDTRNLNLNRASIDNKSLEEEISSEVVSGDANSTIVNFTLDKMYDNEDLTTKTCYIKTVNSSGEKHIQEIEKITDNGDDTITVIWTLDEFCAAETGELLFSLCFGSSDTGYIWQTTISKLNIEQGLVVKATSADSYYDELLEWVTMNSTNENIEMADQHPILIIDDRTIITSNNENVLVCGDNDSQLISFQIDRYKDGVDVSEKLITIKYVNSLGEGFRANAVNLDIQDDYIVFSWLVSKYATVGSGNIYFAIEIIGDLTKDVNDYYVWQTKPAVLKIEESVGTIEFTYEEFPNWYGKVDDRISFLTDTIKVLEQSSCSWREF